ncbi:MAG: NusG domain II-containing protein [Firmicutes bacterium]|nr:NusG domain II-containing protein [Bacillota bacterium]
MKKFDFLVILGFLAAAGLAFALLGLAGSGGKTADVYVKGKYYDTLPLDKDTVYIPKDVPSVKIEVRDGKVGFIESDCPDKVCIHTGFLGTAGQTAVCLPNAVSVIVRGGDDGGVDAVAG